MKNRRLSPRGILSWLVAVLLLAGTLSLYWPATRHGFINYDDPDYVFENNNIAQGITPQGVIFSLTSRHSNNWHPVTWLSHMVDAELFSLSPEGHHLTSICLHALNSLMMFLILRLMTGAVWRSAIVAALFAWHPLRVESVAWVAERKDVLSGFFAMLVLGAYARFVAFKTQNSVRTRLWYGLALLFFALGLMSKPMLVTLPFVMLLLDFWPLRRIFNPERNDLDPLPLRKKLVPLVAEKTPFFAFAAVSCALTLWAQGEAVQRLEDFSLVRRLTNAVVAYGSYIGKMFYPANLSIVYPYPSSWPTWKAGVALLVLATASIASLRLRKRCPWLMTGWLWYLGMLVPVIGLVQVGTQAMADRYTYLPMIGLLISGVWGAWHLAGNRLWARISVSLLLVALLAGAVIATTRHLPRWKNSETLYRHALSVTKDNALVHYNLALELMDQGRWDEALHHCREVLKLFPEEADTHNNVGRILSHQGKRKDAVEHYRRAIQANPLHLAALNNLGMALIEEEQWEEAALHFENAVHHNPQAADPRFNLGRCRARQGKPADAMRHYREALKLNPAMAQAHLNLGSLLAKNANFSEAQKHFSAALKLHPNDPTVHLNLALLFAQQAKVEEAIPHLRRAIELDPQSALARNELAWVLATHPDAKYRNGPEAVHLAERACELTEWKRTAFLGTLDAAYAEAGRFDDAIQTAKKVIEEAQKDGQELLAKLARERLALYQKGQPYRESP